MRSWNLPNELLIKDQILVYKQILWIKSWIWVSEEKIFKWNVFGKLNLE